ncbi:MAG: 3'-5' exonuclease, partial [Ignavibacteriales bacterium]|nr:3'-5' exonuclease [Ignavibacteriales bacterium]
PRMVQLAWLLFDDKGGQQASGNHIIQPVGFSIPADAARVHGITTERAMQEGVALLPVLEEFREQIEKASFLVAHNISFDEKIIGAEYIRNKIPDVTNGKSKICTMTGSVNYCAISGPYGFKWPKLSELHRKLFGADFNEAHNAMVDIGATAKCFWELRRLGVL